MRACVKVAQFPRIGRISLRFSNAWKLFFQGLEKSVRTTLLVKGTDEFTEGKMMNNGEEQLEHIIRGHGNAQATIRAMDTKSSILFAFASATMAGVWVVLSALIFLSDNGLKPCQQGGVILALWAGGFGWAALIQCLWTLFARGCPVDHPPTTVLFPFVQKEKRKMSDGYKQKRQNQIDYLAEKITGEMSDVDIREEYLSQLKVLGDILVKKIEHNQKAVLMFIFQIIFLILLCGCYVGSVLFF